jgi:O-antigen ligase
MVTSCAVAAAQHFGWWPPASAFQTLRWTHIPFERVYESVPGSPDLFMGGGLLFHRLKFAHVTSLSVIAALVAGLAWKGWHRAVALSLAALGLLSVLEFPYARAASVALFLSCLLAPAISRLRQPRSMAALSAMVVLAVCLVVLGTPSLRRRFLSSSSSEGSGDRSTILAIGVRAVKEHPWLGAGLGRFRPSYFAPAGTPAHILENPGKAHNQFLSFAAEVGIPGAVLFLFLLVWLISRLNLATIEGRIGGAILAFFVLLSLVHDPLVQAPFSMALSLALGIGLSTSRPLWGDSDRLGVRRAET